MTAPGKVEPLEDYLEYVLEGNHAVTGQQVADLISECRSLRAALAASEERIKALEEYVDHLDDEPVVQGISKWDDWEREGCALRAKIGRTEDGTWEGR